MHGGLQVKQEEVQTLAELEVKAGEAAKTARQVALSVPQVRFQKHTGHLA